ncbi:transcription factor IIA, alpha/beta subunit [Aspergillus cavernicola]|uniref:Transcription factor IIA, alpha/beta subunit n=1 Tax=Aspergillus cavernicola TaxID=176166 RepID=A0ABR4I8T7_9EURO
MSNQLVGTVFERVIQEVCDASQVDFEESGVDQQTLVDLRKSWQKKLSSLGVAQFPWDPPPPQPAPAQPQNQQILPPTATVPSNAPRPPQHPPVHHIPQQQHVPPQHPHPHSLPPPGPPLHAPTPVGASGSHPMGHSPQIKTEPGLNGHPGLPPMSHIMAVPPNAQSARERATNLIQQRYGAAAANSVSQMQAQSQPPMGLPRPLNMPNMPQMPNGQHHQIKQEPGYHPTPHPSLNNAQTDGAAGDALSEWKVEVARRREAAKRQKGEGDHALRDHLRQRMLQLEGGGLMLPLDERESQPKGSTLSLNAAGPSTTPRAQFDGPGGDDTKEEDDEDAINSDLDDPDDLVAEDHDSEDSVGQVMLCTYDKVQRVKNKWKCTLKDGILTTGGKEYVFFKGQGEFEW